MDCRTFESLLEIFLEDGLEPSTRSLVLEHAAACSACGELVEPWLGHRLELDGPDPEFPAAVLAQTSGSPCAQASRALPDFVDRQLEARDRELIEVHLAYCGDCIQKAAILSHLVRELPRLAEVALDDAFTGGVLAATLPARRRVRRWWQEHWSVWVYRPRFALEAAYAGLLLALVMLGAFSTPVAALPQMGLDLIQAERGEPSVWTEANTSLGTFWSEFASLLESVEERHEPSEDKP